MTEGREGFSYPNQLFPVSGATLERVKGWALPLVFGLLGVGLAGLFFTAPGDVALLAAAGVFAFSALENEAFLLFVMFLMPVGVELAGDVPVRDMHVAFHGLVVAGFFAGRLLRRGVDVRSLFRPAVSRASLLFLCVAVVPTILDKGKLTHQSLRSDLGLAAFVGFYFLILAWVNSRERLHKVLRALLLSTAFTALFAVYQVATGGYGSLFRALYPPDYNNPAGVLEWTGRAASFVGTPGNLAGYLTLVLPFALGCYLLGRGRWKALGKWTFGLGVIALFTTQGLGGILGFLASLVLAIFRFARTTKRKVALFGVLCIAVCLMYVFLHIVSPVHTEGYLASDAYIRFALWASAWNLFTHSPALGVGWGNFTAVYGLDDPYFIPDKVAAHNLYMQLLSETGLAGFLAFFYLVVRSWKQAQRQWRRSEDFIDRALAFGVQGALLALSVHGFVDFLFETDPQYGTLFWTMLALLVVSSKVGLGGAVSPIQEMDGL
jgi:putative inorganic carbon (HCO3(-)) transporter